MAAIVAGMHNHNNLHHSEQHGHLHEKYGNSSEGHDGNGPAGQQQGSSQGMPRRAEPGNGLPTARSSTIGKGKHVIGTAPG
jgi:hypothetical protein